MGEYPRENKTEGEKNNCGEKITAEGNRKKGGGGGVGKFETGKNNAKDFF